MSDKHVTRTGEEYADALQALLPLGQAWPRTEESALMRCVRGLTRIWGDFELRASHLLENESDPRTTVELLPDWERNWGLPDPCYKEPQSIYERQLALVMRMTIEGSQSREFFISVAAYIGYTITITEYRPFFIAMDRCGDSRVYGVVPHHPTVKILLRFEGANASTVFKDSSLNGASRVWTPAGNALINTSFKVLGEASGQFDGVGDWITAPDSADFALGALEWTCDCFFDCMATTGTTIRMCGQNDSAPNNSSTSFRIIRNNTNVIAASVCVGGTIYTALGTTQFTNLLNTGWHYLNVTRKGDVITLAIDDVVEGTVTLPAGAVINNSSNKFGVGQAGELTGSGWNGRIDEFRLTVGATQPTTTPTHPDHDPNAPLMRNEWGQPILNARGDGPVMDGELSQWPSYGLGPLANRYYWTVHVDQAKLVWFRVTSGQCGVDPHLRIGTADDLECLLNRWKPAHSQIIFDYSGLQTGGDMAGTP